MSKVIHLCVSVKKILESKRNIEQLDLLIDKYLPEKKKFVKDKIKKEQL